MVPTCENIYIYEAYAFEHKNYASEASIFTWSYAGKAGEAGSVNVLNLPIDGVIYNDDVNVSPLASCMASHTCFKSQNGSSTSAGCSGTIYDEPQLFMAVIDSGGSGFAITDVLPHAILRNGEEMNIWVATAAVDALF